MKKFLNKICVLTAMFSLASCSNKPSLNLVRRTFENGNKKESIRESLESEKTIYYTDVLAMPDSKIDFIVKSNEFEAKVNGEKIPCVFFINSYSFSSIKVNGQYQSVKYITETKEEKTVEHGSYATSLFCAFETDLGDDFSIFYNGKELSFLN